MTDQQQTEYLISYITDNLTKYLIQDYALDLPSALNIVYNSEVYSQLEQKDNYLPSQSPSYIYELLNKEYTTNTQ